MAVIAVTSPVMDFDNGKWAAVFHAHTSKNITMNTKNESSNLLQLVEIDHNQFAVEVIDGTVRANMTQMSRPFGKEKKPSNWLRLSQSVEFMQFLSKSQKCALADLVKVRHGGAPYNHGTWAYDYQVVLEFARWLSPEFSIKVNRLIWKLLTRQAVVAEPINGIEPVIHNKKPWYYYREVLRSLGFSTKSGTVAKRKKENPKEFTMLYNRNFITPGYCNQLHHEALKYGKQLQFSFSPAMSLQGGVI